MGQFELETSDLIDAGILCGFVFVLIVAAIWDAAEKRRGDT